MITESELRDTLATVLNRPAEEIPGDANLVLLGISSLEIMRLVSRWRRQKLPVSFEALVTEPTLDQWLAHLNAS
ncbi:phosphopantetheine-binding protein [Allokutzneria sp. A3M-2-11 16]|uniref:phosphopantetheine-binding protein n=1 Tax=Allokutzneria sp. A3M-2-11 16 TaxID=2962043 RepID=UPI0020B6A701|nr:phosphopantetheine-binding protein [Allokutzneria sp. A3M-2-11 16]MCP3801302.1 phosphopantetheine-binding protein [Allokutzneria sp. A3M-2-11 16]